MLRIGVEIACRLPLLPAHQLCDLASPIVSHSYPDDLILILPPDRKPPGEPSFSFDLSKAPNLPTSPLRALIVREVLYDFTLLGLLQPSLGKKLRIFFDITLASALLHESLQSAVARLALKRAKEPVAVSTIVPVQGTVLAGSLHATSGGLVDIDLRGGLAIFADRR